jgi:hypothetical protein
MKRLPLHRLQKAGILIAQFALIAALSSCGSEKEVRASFEYKTIDETGQSAYNDDYNPGWNAMLALFMGLSGAYGGKADRPDDLPSGYTAKTDEGGFVFGPRLELVRKGAKSGIANIGLSYIDVVGDIMYTWEMKDDGVVFAGLGPYLGYGISGRASFNGMHTPAFGGQDGYKRFDAGLDLSAGYRLPSSWSFSLGYELGLANKSPDPSDYKSYNRALSLNVGYSLDKIVKAIKGK